MEPENYSIPSSESSTIHDRGTGSADDLVFPDWNDAAPLPPAMPVSIMLEWVAEARAMFPNSIPSPEERWRAKPQQEFIL